MPYHPWTAAEVARAAEHRAAGLTVPQVAAALAADGYPPRTPAAVRHTLTRAAPKRAWISRQEARTARQMWREGSSSLDIAGALQRPLASIRGWLRRHVPARDSRRWSAAESRMARTLRAQGHGFAEIAAALAAAGYRRSPGAVRVRLVYRQES